MFEPPQHPSPVYPPGSSAGRSTIGSRLRSRWGLAGLTVVGAVFAGLATQASWLTTTLVIGPKSQEADFGIGRFGLWGYGFAAGALLLTVLVAMAVLAPRRLTPVLSLCALTTAALLAGDLWYVAMKLDDARTVAGRAAADIVASLPDDRFWVAFWVSSGGLVTGTVAVILLSLVALQLPRPDLAPRVVAGLGVACGLVAVAMPWGSAYLAVGGVLRTERFWLWSVSPAAIGLLAGILVLCVLGTAVAVLPRVSTRVLVVVLLVGIVVVNGPWMLDAGGTVAERLAARVPVAVPESGAPRFTELGALLVMVGAVRSFRRGRTRRGSGGAAGQGATAPDGTAVPDGAAAPGGAGHGGTPGSGVAGSPAWRTTAP